ncbi:MAG: hypothetical protein ABMA64_35085 [Myxococcota bacterium]
MLLRGVARLLRRSLSWTVVPTSTIGEARAAIDLHQPTVAVIDLHSAEATSGLELALWVRRRHVGVVVLLTTTSRKSDRMFQQAVAAGWTPLCKPFLSRTLIDALWQLVRPTQPHRTPNDVQPNRPPDAQ